MSGLAPWYQKRLRVLARGPRSYGALDAVDAAPLRRGLIARTPRDVGPNRCEYGLADGGRSALRDARDSAARAVPERRRRIARPGRAGAAGEARL